jgi:isoleucyl-tRNA synthetase
VEIRPDGSVSLAGLTLAPDEVEIQATPRPGTRVAHDDGLVVIIDTELTPELRAEGDARELQRAIQDLRRDAGLALDDRIHLWLAPVPASIEPALAGIATETLCDEVHRATPPASASRATVELDGSTVAIGLRARPPVGAAR